MTPRQSSAIRRIVTLLAVAIVVAACSDNGQEALGGDGLPVKNPAETYGNTSTALTGVVTLESSGCWTVDVGDGAALMVFPEGWVEGEGGSSMTSSDGGLTAADGDTVVGVGGVVAAASFPGVPDGYWGNYLAFCEPAVEEFVVFDHVTSVAQ
jgi:hypothetical protein